MCQEFSLWAMATMEWSAIRDSPDVFLYQQACRLPISEANVGQPLLPWGVSRPNFLLHPFLYCSVHHHLRYFDYSTHPNAPRVDQDMKAHHVAVANNATIPHVGCWARL